MGLAIVECNKRLILSTVSEFECNVLISTESTDKVPPDELDEDWLGFLTNSWWKICIWALAFLVILCLCAFLSKCCYLVILSILSKALSNLKILIVLVMADLFNLQTSDMGLHSKGLLHWIVKTGTDLLC